MQIKTFVSQLIDPPAMYDLMNQQYSCAHVWGVNNKNNGVLWINANFDHTITSSHVKIDHTGINGFKISELQELGNYSSEKDPNPGKLPDDVDMGLVMYCDVLEHYLKLTYPDHDIKVLAMDHVKMQVILATPDRLELRRYDLYESNLEIVGMPLATWLI